MQIELISKKQIEAYARKGIDEFQSYIPITIPRAVSQSRNPDAEDDDVLLIVAREENRLLSFIGRYPARVQNEPSKKIYWVSCWWKAPGVDSGVSRTIFKKFLEISGDNIGLPHLPSHIIKTMKKYNIEVEGRPGMMIRFRSALHQRSLEKSISSKKSVLIRFLRNTSILKSWDLAANIFTRNRFIDADENTSPGFKVLNNLPEDEYFSFIERNFKDSLTIPYRENVEWILNNPWLVEKNEADKNTAERYHFSYISDDFHHFFPVLKEEGKITGAGFFSARDGVIKSLYIFVLPQSKEKFLRSISLFIQGTAFYHTLITYDPHYYSYLKENAISTAKSFEVTRYTGVGNSSFYELNFTDGDGDSCFT